VPTAREALRRRPHSKRPGHTPRSRGCAWKRTGEHLSLQTGKLGFPRYSVPQRRAVIRPHATSTQIDWAPDTRCSSVSVLDCKMFPRIEKLQLALHRA